MNKRIIALEIPETLRQRLKRESFDSDISMSAFIRNILNEYLEEDDTKIYVKLDDKTKMELEKLRSTYCCSIPDIIAMIIKDYIKRYYLQKERGYDEQ